MAKRKFGGFSLAPEEEEEIKKQFIIRLNEMFLQKCEDYTKLNKSFLELFQWYREFLTGNFAEDEINFDISSEFSESTDANCHNIKSDDNSVSEKRHVVKFKNDDDVGDMGELSSKRKYAHRCLQSELYKFLVKYYDVKCPYYKDTTKRIKSRVDKSKKKDEDEEDGYEIEWPFMEPPKNPRSVFDKGPTREEIGEYNRRIFTAYTESFSYTGTCRDYDFNPLFYNEDSDEGDEYDIVENLLKSECNVYLYNGKEYLYKCRCKIRIFSDADKKVIAIMKGKTINLKGETDSWLLYHVDGDNKVDALSQDSLEIYRFVFYNNEKCKNFSEIFSVN